MIKMSKISYTVTAQPQVGYAIKSETVSTESEAIRIAKEWASEFRNTENGVYIEFFRESDHQHGYINPDGAGIGGKNWAE